MQVAGRFSNKITNFDILFPNDNLQSQFSPFSRYPRRNVTTYLQTWQMLNFNFKIKVERFETLYTTYVDTVPGSILKI